MKQINKILIIFYIAVAGITGIAATLLEHSLGKEDRSYVVAVNRLDAKAAEGAKEEELQSMLGKEGFLSVKKISYLKRDALHQEGKAFFEGDGVKQGYNYIVHMLPESDHENEFIRYEYETKKPSVTLQITIMAVAMFTAAVVITIFLFYLKHTVLLPFHKIEAMPYELAKGNYSYDLKESRFKYFGKFLWGLDRLKEELRKNRERQFALEKEKKLMILTVSHDIKTPLSSIYLYTKALSSNLYQEETKRQKIYGQIQEKVQQIEKFMKQIEEMSTTNLLELNVEKEEHYISEFIEPLKKNYAEKFALKKTHFAVEEYEDHLVYADLNRIDQVFQNLLENAMKYGDGKWVRISFYEEDYCQLIKVTSSGGNIESRNFPHLFESFWRGENAKDKPGSGLGLYICKEIMKKLDGDIFAQTEKEGMSFILVFPLYA